MFTTGISYVDADSEGVGATVGVCTAADVTDTIGVTSSIMEGAESLVSFSEFVYLVLILYP